MMSRPQLLAEFIEYLASQRLENEAIELVIAGDFVDFLAIEPHASWTPDEDEARMKIERTMREEPFRGVFMALGRLVAAGHRLTILIGNHDVELALPDVQDALLRHLDAQPQRIHFVDDGRAYRIGGALIEHGNRYDDANTNDWDGLRQIASAMSRFEAPPAKLRVSPGSQLVQKVVNPLKVQYPFIDLLQPQGQLTLLLALAFEPQLLRNWDALCRLWRADRLQRRNWAGKQPGQARQVAADDLGSYDEEIERVFGAPYRDLNRSLPEPVGAIDILTMAFQPRHDSLSSILQRGDAIPADRLAQLRVAMRKLLDGRHAALDGDTAQYGKAAERMRRESQGAIQVVVMGHTHLARHIGDPTRATYINTGTWADIVRVPHAVLQDGANDELSAFLYRLLNDERSDMPPPTYGALRIEADGLVSKAVLAEWSR